MLLRPNAAATDIICAAQALLPATDELLILGGDRTVEGVCNFSTDNINICRPACSTLCRRAQPMAWRAGMRRPLATVTVSRLCSATGSAVASTWAVRAHRGHPGPDAGGQQHDRCWRNRGGSTNQLNCTDPTGIAGAFWSPGLPCPVRTLSSGGQRCRVVQARLADDGDAIAWLLAGSHSSGRLSARIAIKTGPSPWVGTREFSFRG